MYYMITIESQTKDMTRTTSYMADRIDWLHLMQCMNNPETKFLIRFCKVIPNK